VPVEPASVWALDRTLSGRRAAAVWTCARGQVETQVQERRFSSVKGTVRICREMENSSWVVWTATWPAAREERCLASSTAC